MTAWDDNKVSPQVLSLAALNEYKVGSKCKQITGRPFSKSQRRCSASKGTGWIGSHGMKPAMRR